MNCRHMPKSAAALAVILIAFICVGAAGLGAYAAPVSRPAPGNGAAAEAPATGDRQTAVDVTVAKGGVEMIPAATDTVTAEYDTRYYDVNIREENGTWRVEVVGKVSRMGPRYVQLYYPDTGCAVSADVVYGSFVHDVPAGGGDTVRVTAKDSSVKFSSANGYDGCRISVTATDKTFMEYSAVNCPDTFSRQGDTISYAGGKLTSEISVVLTGFTNVDFCEEELTDDK